MVEMAPSFSSVLKDCTIIEGQDFVLKCSVKGTPVPRITWLLNGESPLPSTLPQRSAPVPLALPAFSLAFPTYHSEPCLPKKEAQDTEREWDLGVCCCLAGDTGQVTALSEPRGPHLQDGNNATCLPGWWL